MTTQNKGILFTGEEAKNYVQTTIKALDATIAFLETCSNSTAKHLMEMTLENLAADITYVDCPNELKGAWKKAMDYSRSLQTTCASCGEIAELQKGLCVPCHEHIASDSNLGLPAEYFDANDDPFEGQQMDDTVYYSDDSFTKEEMDEFFEGEPLPR